MPQSQKIIYYVEPNSAALARRAAGLFVEQALEAVAARGVARIAISGGSTPKAAFSTLGEQGEEFRERMPWDKLDLWWVDERCVPPDDTDSNYRMTRAALLDHVPLKPEQIHRIEGEREPDDAAASYEADLKKTFALTGADLPRFDLIQLGMGPDGHTASLFPHTDALGVTDRLATANYVEKLDTWRITLTRPVINHARHVFFLIAGPDKAMILNQVMEGPLDPERLPSQFIAPSNGILTLLLDQAAAALLPAPDAEGYGVIERTE
ncbi:MAG TPA: 6-phosphogluconolactonase [Terracidiphilus sp.]|nr:6-phosphogluconolactonase [Terracidiphilus sp.]